MKYTTTGGDTYITIDYCDCGLTGGCEKCQPIHIPPPQEYKPSPRFDGEQFYEGDIYRYEKGLGNHQPTGIRQG